jgi:hypothetical protein
MSAALAKLTQPLTATVAMLTSKKQLVTPLAVSSKVPTAASAPTPAPVPPPPPKVVVAEEASLKKALFGSDSEDEDEAPKAAEDKGDADEEEFEIELVQEEEEEEPSAKPAPKPSPAKSNGNSKPKPEDPKHGANGKVAKPKQQEENEHKAAPQASAEPDVDKPPKKKASKKSAKAESAASADASQPSAKPKKPKTPAADNFITQLPAFLLHKAPPAVAKELLDKLSQEERDRMISSSVAYGNLALAERALSTQNDIARMQALCRMHSTPSVVPKIQLPKAIANIVAGAHTATTSGFAICKFGFLGLLAVSDSFCIAQSDSAA